MTSILHVLPHPGGGGERIVDMLNGLGDPFLQDRAYLSPAREPMRAVPHVAGRWPRLATRARSADLLHVMGDMATLLCLPLLASRPAVVATHGLSFLRRSHGLRRRIAESGLGIAVERASCTVCTSNAELDELASLVDSGHRDRLRVVLNGVPVDGPGALQERRQARRELGLPESPIVGLYLGQLDEYKDPLTAIRGAELAASRGASLILLVAGDGPLLDAAREHAGDTVRILGFRDDSSRLMAAADFLTLPSRREGLSLALLEAMAVGLPVVAADVPASREALGDTGILVSSGDAAGFAWAFEQVAGSAELRATLGRAAYRRASTQYRVERYLAEMKEVFQDSVERWKRERQPAA